MVDSLEKAIKGLRLCAKEDSCYRCPYRGEGNAEKEILCADKLMLDALQMLEAFRSRLKSEMQGGAPKKAVRQVSKKYKRAVLMMDADGIILRRFDSPTEAGAYVGKNADQIRKACRGAAKTSGGYRWRYEEEYDGLD